ncbi:hypothetical protein AMS68_001791 [Peltaster fructicola]|uniref:Nucleotide-diphospho-sugar transferase domain-containing protein n=1 Tax=Peltaster fructicola TaxID=286661 RepID=A0A6H0XNH8_9PEZI|nr:hypothetical protein AMS68_001791 [Peltaster fructicola]
MQLPRSYRLISAVLVFICILTGIAWSSGAFRHHVRAFVEKFQGHTGRNAYALLLTSSENERYFQSTRVMLYQLLHSDFAGDIPVLVLVTKDVAQKDRARLKKDGAHVVPIEKIEAAEWMDAAESRWQDLLTKLRIFEQVEYDKICYLDTDILIVKNMDGVFDDPATEIQSTLDKGENVEAAFPEHYMFAARTDSWDYEHSSENPNYFNGGFLVFKPSQAMFNYYMELAKTQDLFDWGMMEQSLLNYAHRQGGSMPWQQMRKEWITDHPTEDDYNKGLKAFHDKFWDWQPAQSQFLHDMYMAREKEMEDYWKNKG